MDNRAATAAKEIAFVDPSVSDLGTLLGSLREEVRAVVLNPVGDPIRQMADTLAGISGLRAVHIVAHGAPGEIGFSAGALAIDGVFEHQKDLAEIGAALDPDGELLLWSCETGCGSRGDRFIETLCWATGALVAAASGTVGAPSLGGRWELDTRLGATIVSPPLSPAGLATYAGVLATKTWNGATSGNWSSTASWVGGVVPVTGDAVVIGSTNNTTAFTATADLTVSIASLTLAGKGGQATTVAVTSGATVTVTGAVSLGTNTVIDGTGTMVVDGAISGGGSITANSGVLQLSGTGSIASGGAVLSIGSTVASTLELNLSGGVTTGAITISSANQTLEIGPQGSVTISAAESITSGTIMLSGGTLTDASGVTIGSGATLTGNGTAGAITLSSGTVTQSGGTLTLTSITGSGTVNGTITNAAITASGGTLTFAGSLGGTSSLAISSSSTSTLNITGTVTSAPIAISSNKQTLQIGATGNLTINGAESITSGTITLAGGTLNDTSGMTIGSGATLSGQGTVTANLAGTGTITASGGTLNLSGTVTSGPVFTIATTSASVLEFSGTATTGAITINNAFQTLEVGSGGTLTISAAQTVSLGKIQMAGGTLTDSSGITLGSGGSAGTLTGFGKVAANIAKSGTGTNTVTARAARWRSPGP